MRSSHRWLSVTLLSSVACATGTAPLGASADAGDPGSVDGAPGVDAAPGSDARRQGDAGLAADAAPAPDATPPDAAPPGVAHLLLTEVALAPSGGEFIELLNPTGDPVALADYYVSDSGGYAQVPSGGARVTASDFIARFPAAAVLSPGAVITVALDSKTAFVAAHGVAPTYSLRDGDLDLIAGSTDATLTNDGEVVVAFYWDGRTDLVTDVDAVHVGRPTASNQVLSKSDVAVDGPDADAIPSTYADDDRSMPLQPTAPASGQSTRRISTEPGHERQDGTGNGVDGDDETSEAIDATWSAPGTPTPGEHDL